MSAWLTMPAITAPPARSVSATGALGHERALPDRPHVLRAVVEVPGVALDEHGLHDVVTPTGLLQEVGNEEVLPRRLPEVVVRVDDLARRVDRFLGARRQPVESIQVHESPPTVPVGRPARSR